MDSISGSRAVKVGMVQARTAATRQETFRKYETMIADGVRQGAELICLQELPFDPYFCQAEDHSRFALAEELDGEIARFAAAQASKHGIVLLSGLFERRAPGLFHNTFLVHEANGTLAGYYRKAHIPDDPHYYEKFFFTPGEDAFPAFSTSLGRIGVCICWDQWFPEAARLTAMNGAEIIFFPTAIGWLAEDKQAFGASQLEAWTTIIRSHAIANGVFVCAPNRTGRESQIEFWGNSLICDPYGNRLQQGPTDEEAVLVAELDLGLCEVARTHWPFFRDRRTDLYDDLCRKWRS